MVKAGKGLELLVGALEKISASDSNFSVEVGARLPDLDTGELREIDVLIEYRNGNHKTRIGVECKDKNRKIGVPDIESYSKKISRLDVDKGVIVSSSGFTGTAALKASKEKIILQSIDRACSFNWLDCAGVLEDFIVFKKLEIINPKNGEIIPLEKVKSLLGTPLDLCTLMDLISLNIIPLSSEWKTSENQMPPINKADFQITGVLGPASVKFLAVRVEFVCDRTFSTFGYFINRTIHGDSYSQEFATAPRAISNETEENDTYVLGKNGKNIKYELLHSSTNTTSIRSWPRFVTWSEAYHSLIQIRLRHHINISEACDGLSVSKFLHDFDVSNAGKEFDGVNRFQDLQKSGCATVTAGSQALPSTNS